MLGTVCVIPMADVVRLSFSDAPLLRPAASYVLSSHAAMLEARELGVILRNTLVFMVASVAGLLPAGLSVALLVAQRDQRGLTALRGQRDLRGLTALRTIVLAASVVPGGGQRDHLAEAVLRGALRRDQLHPRPHRPAAGRMAVEPGQGHGPGGNRASTACPGRWRRRPGPTMSASAGRIANRPAAARSCVVAALVEPAKVKIATEICTLPVSVSSARVPVAGEGRPVS